MLGQWLVAFRVIHVLQSDFISFQSGVWLVRGAVERCLETFFEKVGRAVGTHPAAQIDWL